MPDSWWKYIVTSIIIPYWKLFYGHTLYELYLGHELPNIWSYLVKIDFTYIHFEHTNCWWCFSHHCFAYQFQRGIWLFQSLYFHFITSAGRKLLYVYVRILYFKDCWSSQPYSWGPKFSLLSVRLFTVVTWPRRAFCIISIFCAEHKASVIWNICTGI